MRVNVFWVIALMILPLVSYAQVDTLELVEIGSIQASSEITELYVEDLDGDSLKEIILCTDYFVYIYDNQTYQVEWTSPPLLAPTDLLFEDINGDGLTDLSVKDSTNIHLFDPHTPQTIWTSPPLDSTYKCYTIGDRNDDDWVDVAIVSMEWFTRSWNLYNMDTVWVDLYDGPTFSDFQNFVFLINNYVVDYGTLIAGRTETPFTISINEITESAGLEIKIFIYSYTRHGWINEWSHSEMYNTGSLRIFNSIDFSQVLLSEFEGKLLYYEYQESGDSVTLNAITRSSDTTYDYTATYWDIYSCSADSVLESYTLYRWQQIWPDILNWDGLIIGDFNYNNPGLENCYGAEDTLVLLRFPEVDTIWTQAIDDIDSVLYRYAGNSLYNSPQIICAIGDPLIEYNFFNGSDGALSSILPDPGYELSQVADLNGDINDEILSFQGSALYIYDLDFATGIGDNARLPQRAFLRTNYPNPFNSSTTIEYGLPEAEHVRIEIYDLLGRKVETLVNEEMQAGRHQVVWEADRYASGLYFYRIEAEDYSDTKRMVYLK